MAKTIGVQRITGVKYPVEFNGIQYIAAWKSPERVKLYTRDTQQCVVSYSPKQRYGLLGVFTFEAIAAASDAATRFSLTTKATGA